MKKVLSAPTMVNFCITRRCNLRCKHCFAASQEELPEELALSQLKFVIDRLNEAKVFTIIITGGEPLIRQDFFEIASYIKRYPIRLGLNTNANLVTDKVSKEIAELKIGARISVSLDGAGEQDYELLRGPKTFEPAIRGIENLFRYNKNIRLFCVVTKYNFRELEDIIKLAKLLGAPYVEFNCLLRGERSICYPSLFLEPEQKIESFERIMELKEIYGSYIGGSFVRMAMKAKRLLSTSDDELLKLKAGFLQNCDAGFGMAAIRPDGKVAPCYTMLDYTVGDLLKQSLKDIWQNSQSLQAFRRMHNVNLDEIEQCKNCIYKGLCNAGCRAGAYYYSQKTKLDTYDPEACFLFLRKVSP